ncbi:MAG: hypothetical protein ACLS34_07900 [Faecalibacterium sp.]
MLTSCSIVLFQLPHQFLKTFQSTLQIFNNIRGKFVRRREIVQIGKRLVLQPENIQTGFITFQNFIYRESAPAALLDFPVTMFLCVRGGFPDDSIE